VWSVVLEVVRVRGVVACVVIVEVSCLQNGEWVGLGRPVSVVGGEEAHDS